ncbi:hypothetical protein LTR35_009631 [Friedmanniomyces endolithicus]|uniref:Uncharacterized protein n=1 Tax=Friedmanniomyces endolithicus TaxID=329885 RepID=A0AAN6J9A3_9PEZI|nr:hypothetical protein LTR35_009631 [Friedmanniomyces endolithicus]KAK0301162.1 hypothetical protein LTS00_000311 [Friedmanniomyces endolithicus]KAK0321247.1 hypothetical protein LTR82_007699 [Friedmanniomyces endolithicus]KAK0983879.1 hypothetical protein LTR54_014171 [Friedmanniomyces endolithicus]
MANNFGTVFGGCVDEAKMPSIDIILEALHVDSFPWHVGTFTGWNFDPYGHRVNALDQTNKTQLKHYDTYMPPSGPMSSTNPISRGSLPPVSTSATTHYPSTQSRRLPLTSTMPQEQTELRSDAVYLMPSDPAQPRPVRTSLPPCQTAQSWQPANLPASNLMANRDRARVWYGSNPLAQESHEVPPAAQGITRNSLVSVGATLEPPAKKARRTTSSAQQEAHRLATQTTLSGTVDRVQGDQDQQAMRQPTDPRSTKRDSGTETTPPLFLVRAAGSAMPPRQPVRISSTRPRPAGSQLYCRCIGENLVQLEPGMESSPVMMIGLPLGGIIEQAHIYRDDAVARKKL